MNDTITTFSYKATTKDEIKDELIIALFMNNIKEDASRFYHNYFSTELEYFNYEFKIIDISEEGGSIHITIGITPMIGAHNPVGYDEVTYKINSSGEITLEQFVHLKSYDIPERFKELIIKQLH